MQMSSLLHETTAVASSVAAHREDELDIDHFSTPHVDSHLPSPFNHSQTLSNSASPSYNTDGTPTASSENSYYQSDIDDPFFGVNFDDAVYRVNSLPTAPILGNVAYQNRNRPHPTSSIHAEQEVHPAAVDRSHHP